MLELAMLFSIKSYALTALVSVVVGGVLGFLYGGKVEKKAQAAAQGVAAKATAAVSSISAEVKKL